LLTDGNGIPLSLVAAAANRHDIKLLAPTLDAVVAARPAGIKQHLCADAGYSGQLARQAIETRGYIGHVRPRKQEAQAIKGQPGFKARRWVVERTHSWLNRSRKLLVSFEKTEKAHTALLCLAAALICWGKCFVISG
jgi:putative transposase